MTRNPSLTAFNQTETDRLASDHVAVREPLRPSKARSSSKASRPESSQGVAGSLWKALRTPTSSALARESILAIFDQAVVSGTSFATAVVVGRLLSQESLGIYYLAFTVVVLARGVQEQLVSSPCKVFLQRCEGMERRQYSGSVFVHHALVAAVTVLGLALVLLAGLGPSELSPVLSVLLVAGPLLLLRDFIRQLCFAELRPFEAIRIDIVVAVLQLGGLAVLAVLDLLSVAAIYAVMGAACLLPAGLWFVSSRREPIQWRLGRIGRDWITNWSFGRWALMSFLLVSTSPYVVPWLIVTVQGKAATGMWAACMTLVNAANVLVIGVGNYLTSRAAHAYAAGGVAKLRRVLWSIGLPVLTCLAGFMGLATLFGEAAAVFVFGPTCAGTGLLIFLLSANLAVVAIGIIAGNGLWAMGKPAWDFGADLSVFIVTVAAAAILVTPFGVVGAAAGLLMGTMVGSCGRVFSLVWLIRSREEASLSKPNNRAETAEMAERTR